jgi:Gpi18-like mannosyltransferase
VFPTSYFLHIAYTESLFLALTVGSVYAARLGRWKTAGALGMAAALTRVNGAILFPVLLLEAWLQRREQGLALHRAWPVLLLPAGVLVYLCLNYAVYGDPLQFLQIQREHWYKQLAPPWRGFWEALKTTVGHPEVWTVHMLGVQELLFATLAIAATLVSAWRLRPTYTLWLGANTLLFVSTSFLQSVPRYCLTLFPMMMLAARVFRSTPAWTLLVVASSLLLAIFSYQFSIGRWAF